MDDYNDDYNNDSSYDECYDDDDDDDDDGNINLSIFLKRERSERFSVHHSHGYKISA